MGKSEKIDKSLLKPTTRVELSYCISRTTVVKDYIHGLGLGGSSARTFAFLLVSIRTVLHSKQLAKLYYSEMSYCNFKLMARFAKICLEQGYKTSDYFFIQSKFWNKSIVKLETK